MENEFCKSLCWEIAAESLNPPIYLSDCARAVSGYPINISAVADLLERADRILVGDGGRDCARSLLPDEIEALGFRQRDPAE